MLDAIRDEITRIVEFYCEEPTQRELMLRALVRRGYALHPKAHCRAGAFTLEIYQFVSGSLRDAALRGPAGVELLMNAGFMFDEVADEEINPDDGLSAAEELALAIAMQSCGPVFVHNDE